MSQYLDKTVLSYLWSKINSYTSSKFLAKSGGSIHGSVDIYSGNLFVNRIYANGAAQLQLGNKLLSVNDGISFLGGSGTIYNLVDPTADTQAANKHYVDSLHSSITTGEIDEIIV